MEFAGGHIRGAMHSPDPFVAIKLFILDKLDELRLKPSRVALIFHCEFSEKRAPAAYVSIQYPLNRFNNAPTAD